MRSDAGVYNSFAFGIGQKARARMKSDKRRRADDDLRRRRRKIDDDGGGGVGRIRSRALP